MIPSTTDVLRTALEAARRNDVRTVVVASTTGRTALELADMAHHERIRIIVVGHAANRGKNFDEAIEKRLAGRGILVFRDDRRIAMPRVVHSALKKLVPHRWRRELQVVKEAHGTGICVCHKILWMLVKARTVLPCSVVAIAGTRTGADSAGFFSVPEGKKKPRLVAVIAGPLER